MPDLFDINLQLTIGFSLVMIVGLLTYIAFFKPSPAGKKSLPADRQGKSRT